MEKKTKNDGLKSKVKETIVEWFLSSTSHGLPNIFRNKSYFLKILWLICFCLSTSYCVYSIYLSIAQYYAYQVTSQISEIFESPTEFPTCTVCNQNPFITQAGIDFSKSILLQNGISDPMNVSFLNNISQFKTPLQDSSNLYFIRNLILTYAYLQNETTLKTFGSSALEFMPLCLGNGGVCNYTRLKWYYDPTFGNCYQFNSGYDVYGNQIPIGYTDRAGKRNGFFALILSPVPDNIYSLSFFSGAHVYIHNHTVEPNLSDGIEIQSGTQVNIGVRKYFTEQLAMPYNDCYDDLTKSDAFDSYLYRKTLELGLAYRQKRCLNVGIQYYVIERCNCTYVYYPNINKDVPYCTSLLKLLCAQIAESEIFLKNLMQKFYSLCPMECSRQSYQFSYTASSFPSRSFGEVLLNNTLVKKKLLDSGLPLTYDSLKENTAWINIYLDDIKYTLVSESPSQTSIDLLGSVGGTMGLYIGISFLSIVEVIEIIFQIIFLYFDSRKKIKKTEPIE